MKTFILILSSFCLFLSACKSPYTARSKITESPEEKLFNDARTWTSLRGKWYGKQERQDGQIREWLIEHKEDGTFTTTFIDLDENGNKQTTIEYGEWGASGFIYFTILKGFVEDGKEKPLELTQYWSRNAYQIVKLNIDEFIYRDLERQAKFRAIRQTNDFELEQ